MKYITLKESRDKSKYVLAPLDEKNLTTDWLEELCDEGTTCAVNGSQLMCWINNEPIRVDYYGNRLQFTVISDNGGNIMEYHNTDDVIEDRVHELVGDTANLCYCIIRSDFALTFRFYWELGE